MSTRSSKRKRRRGVTKTIVDEHGNVRVVKFKKRKTRTNPLSKVQAFKPKRIPTTLLGTVSLLFAGAAQTYAAGSVESYFGGASSLVYSIFDSMEIFYRAIFTNIAAVGVFGFLGYALITQGISIKKYGIAFRQVMSVIFAYLIISSVLSPFINYPGDIRQIRDESDRTDVIDTSGLTSPFFNPQWDGDIPNLDQILLNLTVDDGAPLDAQRDAYLIKWQTQEKWDPISNDFVQGDTATTQTLNSVDTSNLTILPNAGEDTVRKFKASTLYFTVASSFSGALLAPWNSEIGPTLVKSNLKMVSKDGEDVLAGTPTVYKTLNEDPSISASLSQSGTSGGIIYDAYFIAEKKSLITSTPYKISDYNTILPSLKNKYSDRIPDVLFDTITEGTETYTGIDTVWGKKSLPDSYFQAGGDADFFIAQYNQFRSSLGGDQAGIYATVVAVTNFMQQKMLDKLQTDPNMLSYENLDTDFAGSIDRGLYFYKAINTPGLDWGLLDFMPAYINMLRALGVPARQVTGFAGGQISGNTLQYSLEHSLRWAEVLIPWKDGSEDKLSWGMFNPIPIPSLLSNGIIEFGRNSLGSSATIDLSIDSGESISGSPIKLQQMGDDFNISVDVSFEGVPAGGQAVQVLLLNQDQLNSLQSNPDISSGIPGTELGTFTTDDNGRFSVSGNVDFQGKMTLDQLPDPNVTIESVDVTAFLNSDLNNLEDGANVYGIAAILGFSIGINGTAWLRNGTISVTSSLVDVNIPSIEGQGYITTPFQNITFTATLRDQDGIDPIANESLNFYLLEESAASSLDFNNLDFTVLQNETMISRTSPGDVSPNPVRTDTSGQASVTINFDDPFGTTPGSDDVYVLIVEWKGNLVYSEPIGLLVSLQSSLSSEGSFPPGIQFVGTNEPSDPWILNATLISTTALLGGSTPGISGIAMKLVAVEYDFYNGLTINTYNDFDTNVLQSTSFVYILGASDYTINSGSLTTDANGKVSVNITIIGTRIANEDYYLFFYSDDVQEFSQITDAATSNPFVFAKRDTKALNAMSMDSGVSSGVMDLNLRRRVEA